MKLFQWHFGLYLIPLAFLLPMSNANAAPIITCSASISNIDFGSIDLLSNNRFTTTGTVNYTCKNTGDAKQDLTLCISLGNAGITPRAITPVTTGLPNLPFQMYKDSGYTNIWGSVSNPTTKEAAAVNVTLAPDGTQAGAITIYAAIPANQGEMNPGIYKINYADNNTLVSSVDGLNKDCKPTANPPLGPGVTQTQRMNSFYVQANAPTKCKIDTKPDINLGPYDSSEKNITGNSNIGVTCTKSTPYNIGLAPATSDPLGAVNTGSGLLNGTGSNTNTVPYQLYSDTAGTKWGNNGSTVAILTNGVKGTGDGKVQSKTVYVTVPSADFKPDTYTDTVTINVNY